MPYDKEENRKKVYKICLETLEKEDVTTIEDLQACILLHVRISIESAQYGKFNSVGEFIAAYMSRSSRFIIDWLSLFEGFKTSETAR